MNSKSIIVTLEEEDIDFANYSDGEKPYGFCILHTGAFFHKGVKVRYTCKSTAGINYVMTRHNRHASYDVYASPKLRRGFNKNY